MKFIEVVEEIFDITGRGCVIVPGVPYDFEFPINIDSTIEFHNPDGSRVQTKIQGFEMINRGKMMDHAPFSLPKTVKKTQILKGAKIYLLENGSKI